MKVGVIGDCFVDRYWVGQSSRISAEVPIPIVNVDMKFDLAGGAANVRANLRSLGVEGLMLFKALGEVQNYPIKNRLLVGDHQIARWDEEDYCVEFKVEDLYAFPEDLDGIVVADYGKGSISKGVIQYLRELPVPVFVDTKSDPSPWIGSEVVVFPNLKEFRQFEQIYQWFPRIVLKQGALGISLLEFGQVVLARPALARFVRSVNGAGDTVIAAFVAAYLGGGNLDYCLEFANAAAGVVVEKPFTATATVDEVEQRLYEDS